MNGRRFSKHCRSFKSFLVVIQMHTVDPEADAPGYRRYYSLEHAGGTVTGAWSGVEGFTNLPGVGQVVVFTNVLPATAPALYRGRVQLRK